MTAYAVGVAMNNFLPANIGTFATLVMFVAIIRGATFPGCARRLPRAEDLLHDRRDVRLPLPLPLCARGRSTCQLGNVSDNPVTSVLVALGIVVLVVILCRIFWRQVKKLWEQAKQGGAILKTPRKYFTHSFLPSLLSWLCKLAVIAIFLAAFAIPVTFESIMWVTGSGSLANVVSVTPGAVGITQATNALALDTCCDVAKSTAVDYSTAQQLITTAWNVVVAVLLVVLVFGWTGGKKLVDPVVRGREGEGGRAEGRARREEDGEASGARAVRARPTPSPP